MNIGITPTGRCSPLLPTIAERSPEDRCVTQHRLRTRRTLLLYTALAYDLADAAPLCAAPNRYSSRVYPRRVWSEDTTCPISFRRPGKRPGACALPRD